MAPNLQMGKQAWQEVRVGVQGRRAEGCNVDTHPGPSNSKAQLFLRQQEEEVPRGPLQFTQSGRTHGSHSQARRERLCGVRELPLPDYLCTTLNNPVREGACNQKGRVLQMCEIFQLQEWQLMPAVVC